MIKLTHANKGQQYNVVAEQIFYTYFSKEHKSMIVVSTGGAFLPVAESEEEVERLIKQASKGEEDDV